MPFALSPTSVEPAVAGWLGAVDVDGGATPEQLRVLRAIVRHVLGRADLDLAGVAPLGPAEVATALTGPTDRRAFREVLVALEACRHPLTAAQVARADDYSEALGLTGPDRLLLRELVEEGADRAGADYQRFLAENLSHREEPALRHADPDHLTAEPELAARLEAMADCPDGSLGRAFVDFYRRSGILLPGVEASALNHFYVAHDMTHVIAGIEPTAAGEIALSAMLVGMDDGPVNTSALLASLMLHEVGVGRAGKVHSEAGVLDDPVAARLLGSSLARGAACRADFSVVDHFDLADEPLAEVRAHYGVRPPDDPHDGHHHW